MKKIFVTSIIVAFLTSGVWALSWDSPLIIPLSGGNPLLLTDNGNEGREIFADFDGSPFFAFGMSAVVPGSGQIAYGSVVKGGVFLGLEAVTGGGALIFHHKASLSKEDFISFAVSNAGAYKNGSDKYFEDMENWRASGTYIDDPELFADVRNDEDTYGFETYNEHVWETLYEEYRYPVEPEGGWTYGMDDIPEENRQDMFEDFKARAWTEEEGWEWDDDTDMNEYKDKRAETNIYYKNATFFLSAMIVNHFIAAVDAARTASARRNNADGLSMRFEPDPLEPRVVLNWRKSF
jgi:hypothetical protein